MGCLSSPGVVPFAPGVPHCKEIKEAKSFATGGNPSVTGRRRALNLKCVCPEWHYLMAVIYSPRFVCECGICAGTVGGHRSPREPFFFAAPYVQQRLFVCPALTDLVACGSRKGRRGERKIPPGACWWR